MLNSNLEIAFDNFNFSPDYLSELEKLEKNRQKESLNLIASENYPSPVVLKALSEVWSLKYGEGYPGKRFYAGNEFTDKLEDYVKNLALSVFAKNLDYQVNLQVLSGSMANQAVLQSILNPGDTVIRTTLDMVGHLSHLQTVSNQYSLYKVLNLPMLFDPEKNNQTGQWIIDIQALEDLLVNNQVKLLILGFSSYPCAFDFGQIIELAHKYQVLVLADIAHISGLVAAGFHSTPFMLGTAGADFVTTTTHKTMRGPRGAMVFAKNYLPDYWQFPKFVDAKKASRFNSLSSWLDQCIFPGMFGGPHFHFMHALGNCLLEILGIANYPDKISFKNYIQNLLENQQTLESFLIGAGFKVPVRSTNHLSLIELPSTVDSLEVQKNLEKIGIICNRYLIPLDTKSAFHPSGLRLGMAALTSRNISKKQIQEMAEIIHTTVYSQSLSFDIETALRNKVKTLAKNLGWFY